MQMGNGEGNGAGNKFRDSRQDAIETAKLNAFGAAVGQFVGTLTGFAFTTFVMPFLIVYAYNGLQPAVWPDISYLPTMVGLFVFRNLVRMIRTE